MDEFVFKAGEICRLGSSNGSVSNFWDCLTSLNFENRIADYYLSNFEVVIHPQAQAWADELHRLLWEGAAPTLSVAVACYACIRIVSGVFKGM